MEAGASGLHSQRGRWERDEFDGLQDYTEQIRVYSIIRLINDSDTGC